MSNRSLVTQTRPQQQIDIPQTQTAPYRPQGQTVPYQPWRRRSRSDYVSRRTSDPYQCAHCGKRNTLKAMPAIWSTQSTIAHSRKGLVIKTGWAETRRQSYLAKECAPPKRKGIVLKIIGLLLFLVVFMNGAGVRVPGVDSFDLSEICGMLGFVQFFFLANAIRWNHYVYPKKRKIWQSTFVCSMCSGATIIEYQR